MIFTWDEPKRQRTIAERGLDFADLPERFDWARALYREDFTRTETRKQAIGYLTDMVVIVVFTMRGDECRVISLRKAEPKERRQYENQAR